MRKLTLFILFILSANIFIFPKNIKPLSEYNLNSHDISSLPYWGPYSKRYAGISHIPKIEEGLRFDFSVMPGYYRNKQLVPHVLFESSYFPWDFSPEMNKITYRYQLEWRDRVYVDVTYYILDESKVVVEIKTVNNTGFTQNLVFNNFAYIDYPEAASKVRAYGAENLKWQNAIDYEDLSLMKKSPQYNLVYDGWMRGERLDDLSLSRSILGKNFGRDKGDKVSYRLSIDHVEGEILFRYKMGNGKSCSFAAGGLLTDTIHFKGTGDFELLSMPYKTTKTGEQQLSLSSLGGDGIDLDGFFIGEKNSYSNLEIKRTELPFTPVIEKGKGQKDFILKYPDIDSYYGVAWNYAESEIRQVLNSELESFFRKKVHDHVSHTLAGDRKWHYTNAFLRPVVVAPESENILYMLIATGAKGHVEQDIALFHSNPEHYMAGIQNLNQEQKKPLLLPGSEQYQFGYRMLQSAVLSNISYPIYTQREYIRHFTPGKNWNSLYTWDLGYIALGLIDIDQEKAFEAIKAYTTPVASQSAFIHHGTPLPIQMFAYFDLWNMDKNKEMLAFLYPRLKQYYDFMAGNTPTSTTRMAGSNLLKTWDYFYNSGGWDDYPPQHYFHNKDKSNPRVTPVVTTAFYIRAAKILRMAAKELGYKNDVKFYDKQIGMFSNALQQYSWDEQAGYFGYVSHDKDGNATGIYRYPEDNSNFNKGLDGVSPLVAGICTKKQEDALVDHVFSESELWTGVGISTVDQSASYYKADGYWNGAVWMPHQWNVWKALLDCGRASDARKIAETALQTWEKECRESNYTFEHFIISSGRGAGWHQFSGLSSPVVNWFSAYYKVGKVTTGFEIWIAKDRFADNYSSYQATLVFDDSTAPRERSMLVCLNPDFQYEAYFNGKKLEINIPHSGCLEVQIPVTNKKGELSIIRR